MPYDNEAEVLSTYVNNKLEAPVADALADTTDQELSLAQISRFIKEIRFFSPEPGKYSGPQGRSLAADSEPERLHPLHKFHGAQGNLLVQAKQLVTTFLSVNGTGATAAAFVAWLKQRNVPECQAILDLLSDLDPNGKTNLVEYYDMVNRQRFAIEPSADGLIYCRKPKESSAGSLFFDLAKYDTSASKAALDGGAGMAIWVQSPSGRFYSSTQSQRGKFHHSSFLAGRMIRAAGDWMVSDGKLRFISAKSGHYMPPLEALQGAITDLCQVSPKLIAEARVIVHRNDEDADEVMLPADEFRNLNATDLKKYQASSFG